MNDNLKNVEEKLTFCNWIYNSAKKRVVFRTLCVSLSFMYCINSASLYCSLKQSKRRKRLLGVGSTPSNSLHSLAPVYRKFCSSIDYFGKKKGFLYKMNRMDGNNYSSIIILRAILQRKEIFENVKIAEVMRTLQLNLFQTIVKLRQM